MACQVWSCRALAALVVAGLSAAPSFAQVTTTYSYDPQGQVQTVTRPTQTVTYAYDAAANRTQMTSTAPLAGRAAAQASSATTSSVLAKPVAPPPLPAVANTPPPPFPPPPPPPVSPLSGAAPSVVPSDTVAR
jgi:YD repeat-containing protein